LTSATVHPPDFAVAAESQGTTVVPTGKFVNEESIALQALLKAAETTSISDIDSPVDESLEDPL
jgi:hypothetical protein